MNMFINQYRSKDMNSPYHAGVVALKAGKHYSIYNATSGAEDTFSIGQPVYDEDLNLMGYLGIGLYTSLDYSVDIRIPVEYWEICLPTEHCKEGKRVITYWQMLAAKDKNDL